ncbi:MAG: PDZ domain-containing protein [Isosphaeraceae bacterium]
MKRLERVKVRTAVATSLLVVSAWAPGSARAQGPTRDQAALIVEGVVREVFRSPRRDQVDHLIQLDVQRAELGRTPRQPVRLVLPAPGDAIYIHVTERPGAALRPDVPAERSRVRAYLVPRPHGGWDATPRDGFEIVEKALVATQADDPPPPIAQSTPTSAGTPTSNPQPRGTGGNALDRLGLSADPIEARGRFALRVKSVERGGAAQRAGLEPGDVIVAANDRELTGLESLDAAVMRGGRLTLVVLDVNSGRAARISVDSGSTPGGTTPPVPAPSSPHDPTPPPTTPPPSRPTLGFSAEPVTIGQRTGMKVTGVDEGGLAQKAGLEPGDVIVSVNRIPVTNVETLSAALRKSGSRLELMVRDTRTGKDTPIAMDLGGEPAVAAPGRPAAPPDVPGTPASGQRLGVVGEVVFYDAESAVKVTEVEPGSPADRAGLRPGDVIVEADGTAILHPNTLNEVVSRSQGKLRITRVDPRSGRKSVVDVDLGSR